MTPDDKEEDFAALLAEYDAAEKKKPRRKEPQPGEEVRGRIVSIGRDAAFVELGLKAEAVIDLAELRDDKGQVAVQVGDEIEARVVESKDGTVILRRVLGRGTAALEGLAQAAELAIPVEGVVGAAVKGGVEVQVAGVRAFCPVSQLDLRHVEDASVFTGQRLQFRVTRFEGGPRPNVVLSRRVLLEEAQAESAAATRARLAIGAVMRGKITALKDYGAFVDLGGIEGMLHVSEIGFSRIAHPKDVLSVGQEIEVQVLKIEKTGEAKRPEKVALSLKSLERDPWADIADRAPEGGKLKGIVARVEAFGAFVELFPGVEGLLHVSELGSKKKLRHAREAVKVGQSLTVTVLTVDPHQRRISLSLDSEPEPSSDSESASVPTAASESLGTFADLLKKPRK
jgi:small subunit ribosomal protein S1